MRSAYAQRGVTLVELLVTVSIAAILVVIAVPSMSGLIADSRLSSQSDLLVAALNTARMEAVKQRTDVKLCPAANANTDTACSTNAADWSNGWLVMSGSTILQRISSKSGLTMLNTAATPLTAVTFAATFGATTPATGFTLCVSGRAQQAVNVAASGHVSKSFSSTIC